MSNGIKDAVGYQYNPLTGTWNIAASLSDKVSGAVTSLLWMVAILIYIYGQKEMEEVQNCPDDW